MLGCTGKRSRTSLVKVCDFTEKQLMADIRLMDEIERDFDSARRREPQRLPCRLPQRLQELHREVRALGPLKHGTEAVRPRQIYYYYFCTKGHTPVRVNLESQA